MEDKIVIYFTVLGFLLKEAQIKTKSFASRISKYEKSGISEWECMYGDKIRPLLCGWQKGKSETPYLSSIYPSIGPSSSFKCL